MYQSRHPLRDAQRWVDIIHVVLCIVVTVMAVFAFLWPEENKMLFPLIFLSIAIVRLSSAVYLLAEGRQEKKVSVPGLIDLLLGVAIFALGVVSAVSIWR